MNSLMKTSVFFLIGLFICSASAVWAEPTAQVTPQMLAKRFKPQGDGGSHDVPRPEILARSFKPQGDGGSCKVELSELNC